MKKGMEKGLKEGIEKGIEKGQYQAHLKTAEKMKQKGYDHKVISECTGLSLEEIEKL